MPITEAAVGEALAWAAQNAPESYVFQHVRYAATQDGAPLAYHVAGALSIASVLCPLDLELWELRGAPYYPHTWWMVLGEQGPRGRKSNAVSLAKRVLRAAVPDLASSPAQSPQEQVESFADERKPRQLIFESEGGSFFAATKGTQNMVSYKPVLTKLYDGDVDDFNTKKSKVHVARPRPTLLMGINPTFLGQHADRHDWHNGFLHRFGFIYAKPEREIQKPLEPARGPGWEYLVNWIAGSYSITSGPPGGALLTPEAYERYFAWDLEYTSRRVPGAEPNIHSRGSGQLALRVALVFAWELHVGRILAGKVKGAALKEPLAVPIHAMEMGIRMAEWHYQSLCEISSEIITSNDMRDRRAILRALEDQPGNCWIPLGQILRDAQMLKHKAQPVLLSLVEEKLVENCQVGTAVYWRKRAEAPDYTPLSGGVNMSPLELPPLPPLRG